MHTPDRVQNSDFRYKMQTAERVQTADYRLKMQTDKKHCFFFVRNMVTFEEQETAQPTAARFNKIVLIVH